MSSFFVFISFETLCAGFKVSLSFWSVLELKWPSWWIQPSDVHTSSLQRIPFQGSIIMVGLVYQEHLLPNWSFFNVSETEKRAWDPRCAYDKSKHGSLCHIFCMTLAVEITETSASYNSLLWDGIIKMELSSEEGRVIWDRTTGAASANNYDSLFLHIVTT